MDRPDRVEKTKTDSQPEQRDSPERKVAPPIEREHETQEGVIEEDEHRKHERR